MASRKPRPQHPGDEHLASAERVERRMAALEGAEAAVLLSNGMGAVASSLLALLRPGDHLLASAWMHGRATELLTTEFESLGIAVTFVDPTVRRVWRKHLRKHTRAIFVTTPVPPAWRVLDLEPLSFITRQCGIALVVDSTFASPVNLRPIEHGADVVIHAVSPYLNGHDDVQGGIVCGTAPYIDEVRRKMLLWGQAPGPVAAWLLDRGLGSLDVRVRRQNENAQRVAEWCAGRKEIRTVHYPGLPGHPDHAAAQATMDGFGGMMTIELAGGARACERLRGRLRVFQPAPGPAGIESRVIPAAPLPEGFVGLSIGIESANELIGDLEQALH